MDGTGHAMIAPSRFPAIRILLRRLTATVEPAEGSSVFTDESGQVLSQIDTHRGSPSPGTASQSDRLVESVQLLRVGRLRSLSCQTNEEVHVGNKIVHWELMGPDGPAMQKFYGDMFGWETEGVEGFNHYYLVSADSAGAAGAVGQGPEEMPSYLMIYVEVPDIDAHLSKIEAAGGKIHMPRTVVPDTVIFAMFTDPAGNVVGLVESDA